jgi:hypothetical protein
MDKVFSVAGVSTLNGVVKYRFANALAKREAILRKGNHTAIKLIELPNPMTKEAAVAFIEANADFDGLRPTVEAKTVKTVLGIPVKDKKAAVKAA